MPKIRVFAKVPRNKLLLSIGSLSAAAALVIGATFAFFSDTETSEGNTLAAGEIDLGVDNESYYNGVANVGTSWLTSYDLGDGNGPSGGKYLFYNFDDLKPGDYGEDTISLTIQTNDAWLCTETTITTDDDVSCNEPELADDPACTDPGAPGNTDAFDGDLADNLEIMWWADDGDNVLETDETILDLGFIGQGPQNIPVERIIADSNGSIFPPGELNPEGALIGEQTYYIAKAWCFGNMTPAPLPQSDYTNPGNPTNAPDESIVSPEDGGFKCDGTVVDGNAAQTDKVMMDISFYAEQARNNDNFQCTPGGGEPTPPPTEPPQACEQADVMLVLDRSGSISSTELGQLKTAAKDFVDALGLSTTGIHAGKSSFSTTGSLNHHLTDDPVSLKAVIDVMVSGGLTNLKEGLDLAITELGGGDFHDRTDLTSPDIMIVITDGHPNRPLPSSTADDVAAASATSFKSGGGEVFVVGVGGDVNTVYLQGIATDASHYFSVSDYSALKTTLENLDLCNGD